LQGVTDGAGQTSDRALLAALEATWQVRAVGRKRAFLAEDGDTAELSAFKRFRRGILKPMSAEGGRMSPDRYLAIRRTLKTSLGLSEQETRRLDDLHEQYWVEHRLQDARRSRFQAVRSRPGHTRTIDAVRERFERHGLSLTHMFSPDVVLAEIKKLTTSLSRAKNGYNSAIDALWMADAYLGTDEGKAITRHDERVVLALRALFMREVAWNALQSENRVQMLRADRHLQKFRDGSGDPEFAVALNSIGTFSTRISYPSGEYPTGIDFAQEAFMFAQDGLSSRNSKVIIKGLVNDPLLEYFAANELRLQRKPLFERYEVLGNKTIEESMVTSFDVAESSADFESAIRIGSGLCRGYLDHARLKRAHRLYARMVAWRARVTASSRAGLQQVHGLIQISGGALNEGLMSLLKAVQMFEEIGAVQRASDVRSDIGALFQASQAWLPPKK
jgi:hypothetical protein